MGLAGAVADNLGPMRQRLLALIREHPGQHASELSRTAGGPWSTVQYHLDLLAKGDLVQAVDAGRTKRFYPREMDERAARLFAVLQEGRREAVARFILEHPGSRQVDVCNTVAISRKVFRNAVAPLIEEGLIQERRTLQDNRYFATSQFEVLLGGDDALDPASPAAGIM